MTTTQPKFPLDGQADTCLGHGVDAHGTDDELGTGPVDSLCSDCRVRFQADGRQADAARTARARSPRCVGGCTGHTHGSRYFDCLCCYGD